MGAFDRSREWRTSGHVVTGPELCRNPPGRIRWISWRCGASGGERGNQPLRETVESGSRSSEKIEGRAGLIKDL